MRRFDGSKVCTDGQAAFKANIYIHPWMNFSAGSFPSFLKEGWPGQLNLSYLHKLSPRPGWLMCALNETEQRSGSML